MNDDFFLPIDADAIADGSMLGVRDVARMLGISRSFTYELIARRELASARIGRRVVVPAGAVRAFLAEARESA